MSETSTSPAPGSESEPPESKQVDYHDIPGTFVFDATQSRKGYRLNMFCMSLNDEANRAAFRADEPAYLDRYTLSPEQRGAVLDRGWIRLLELGGNIYYTFKLAACDGLSFQQLAALQTGVSEAEYVAMMVAGGRSIEGNRSRSEPNWANADSGTPASPAPKEGTHRG